VIASVIPKSRKIALAIILAPTVLGIDPEAALPSAVLQLYFSTSSVLRTWHVDGIVTSLTPLLFFSLHFPGEPSLNDIANGVMGSLVSDANPTKLPAKIRITIIMKRFTRFVLMGNFLTFDGNRSCLILIICYGLPVGTSRSGRRLKINYKKVH